MLLAIPTYILFLIILFVLLGLCVVGAIFYAAAHKAARLESQAAQEGQKKAREREERADSA